MGLYSNIKPIFDVKPMGFYAREYGNLDGVNPLMFWK